MTGETVCGFRVAAWRETHPEHGDKYGWKYSEHWSTPSSRNPAVRVERLFTEAQLRAALTFTASLSGGEGEGKACAGPARERRGDPSPAQPADALRPGEPEDHLSQLSRIFGRKVTRFKVPGRVDGIQRMEVGFADGDSITTTGADVDSAWRALLAEAETATPDPSNTQAQKMEEG